MIHVVPPQVSPDFVANSPLAAASGWVDVDEATLRHKRYAGVFSLGDAGHPQCKDGGGRAQAGACRRANLLAASTARRRLPIMTAMAPAR